MRRNLANIRGLPDVSATEIGHDFYMLEQETV